MKIIQYEWGFGCCIRNVEICDGNLLSSEFGRANNAIDAVVNYVKAIKGKEIKINSSKFYVPNTLSAIGQYEAVAKYKFEISKDFPEE